MSVSAAKGRTRRIVRVAKASAVVAPLGASGIAVLLGSLWLEHPA